MSNYPEEVRFGGAAEERVDINNMDKLDASKYLFDLVPWQDYVRAGVFFSQNEYQLLERTQDNIDFALGNTTTSKAFVSLLIKLADKCTSSIHTLQYVFTRIEEVLAVGDTKLLQQRCALFTTDGMTLQDGPFLRALRINDTYIQKTAAVSFATLRLTIGGDISSLVSWVCDMLGSSNSEIADNAVGPLCVMVRNEGFRRPFLLKGGIAHIAAILRRLGSNGPAQALYELSFCLWALSIDTETYDPLIFLHAGVIGLMVALVSAASSRKVVRMAVAALYNLVQTHNDDIFTEMLTGGLTKLLETMILANSHKQAGDLEFEFDVRHLFDILMKNFREFSTFERWVAEANTGLLKWGIVHSDKFWRENAKLMEKEDFKMLKVLISLLHSETLSVVAVALYDLGEFTRFYPNGRGVVKTLGGKDTAMEYIGFDDPEVSRQALQCISKIMVTNWEFMK